MQDPIHQIHQILSQTLWDQLDLNEEGGEKQKTTQMNLKTDLSSKKHLRKTSFPGWRFLKCSFMINQGNFKHKEEL